MQQEHLFYLDPNSDLTIQEQLRRLLVDAILDGSFKFQHPLPSCRKFAKSLGISRNTVVLVYDILTSEGFLISYERKGYFVNTAILNDKIGAKKALPASIDSTPKWQSRFQKNLSKQRNIVKPSNWQDYQYPFIYGQIDPALFPISEWRQCSKQAESMRVVKEWSEDRFTIDDPILIEEIRTSLLTRRGIQVAPEEILITLGTQNALYLITSLLVNEQTTIGMEDPGYVDARNIFSLKTSNLVGLPLDQSGLITGKHLAPCDYIYTTPSHQSPTTVTMPLDRRFELLKQAAEFDFILIEDDYEREINHFGKVTPALKSLDNNGRVIYLSSLSKSLAPGLRIGYMVGPQEFIDKVRMLRRLMFRHPPTNNQRTVALFISRGNHTSALLRIRKVFKERWQIMKQAIEEHLIDCISLPSVGGSAFWIEGPQELNAKELEKEAAKAGILIESGDVYFMSKNPPLNFFRLGFSSIPSFNIKPGIALLGEILRQQLKQS